MKMQGEVQIIEADGDEFFESLAKLHAALMTFGVICSEVVKEARAKGERPALDLTHDVVKGSLRSVFEARKTNDAMVRAMFAGMKPQESNLSHMEPAGRA